MITRVKLKNWKSHRDTELRFGDGTNVLVGMMGAGKSLPYKEPIVARYNGKWGKYPIGEIVENALKNAKNVQVHHDTVLTTENPHKLCVFCLNKNTLKIESREVNAFLKHKVSSPLIKIRTRTGRSITVTEDHSLLIFKESGEVEACKGSEIKTGDYLLAAKMLRIPEKTVIIDIPEIIPEFRRTTEIMQGLHLMSDGLSPEEAGSLVTVSPHVLENWKRRGMTHEPGFIIGRDTRIAVPTNILLSNEFAKLAGAYLSEGCSQYDVGKSTYNIRITNGNGGFLEEVRKCWKKIFPNIRYELKGMDFRVHSRVVAALFSRLFGPDSAVKKVPNFMYEVKEELLAGFLGAYFDGDGWVVPQRTEVACSSKSLDLIDALQTLLLRWGVIGKIRERNVNGTSYYDLIILPKHVPALSKHLRFLTMEKQTKLSNTARIVSGRKRCDGIDIIPNVKKLLRSLRLEYHLSSRRNQRAYALSVELAQYIHNQNIGREKLRRCLRKIFEIYGFKSESFRKLERIADSDILFDKIVEVQRVQPTSEWVYDLSVDDAENFVAGVGNLIVHNSAVLDAITYALFGTLPAVQTRRIKLEDLITSRPKPLDRAEVEVNFVAPDGNEYIVKRIVERGSGTALSELRKATGELIESPSSGRVNELIQSLLELDYDLFERAIYSEQNRLDYFLTLQRGRRMESIDELLGINKLEKARKNIVTLSGRVKDRAQEREATANQLKRDPSISMLPVHEQELRDLELAQKEISARLQQLQPELESTRAQVQKFREVEQNLAQLEHSYRELSGAIGALKQQLDEFRERLGAAASLGVEELQKRAGELSRVYSEKVSLANQLNSNLTAAILRLQALETQKKMLQSELDKITAEVARKRKLGDELERLEPEKLVEAIERSQTEFRGAADELAASRAKIQDLKGLMEELSEARAACPVCESPLAESRKQELLQQRQGQLEDLKKRAGELESRLKLLDEGLRQELELQRKCMMLAKEVGDIPKLEEERSDLSKRLGDVELEIPKAREESEKLRSENERAKKEVDELYDKLSNSKQILQLRMDLDRRGIEYRQKLVESERVQQAMELLRSAYDEAKAEEFRRRLEELIGTQERLRAELSGKEQLAAEKRKLLESIREKLAMISRCEAEVRHMRDAAQALTAIQAALARTQTSMRRMFIDGVNEVMSDLWESIYPYGDFVGIQLAVEGGERGGDYVLKLRDRAGGWVPVEGVASGGERTDACLALRIAFSIVLAPNLRWIVFDEPTHNLDADGIQELAKILRERLPEVVRQILIITHEERLESAVSGYLYRFSRDKDSDEPTKVEQVTVPELFE